MGVWKGVRRVLGAVGRFWWTGMNRHASETLRDEIEALERYRDFSRWHARERHEREATRYTVYRGPYT